MTPTLPVTTSSELDLKIKADKSWCSCLSKKRRPKHERELTRHEIDFTIQERAKKILVEEKKK